MQVRIGSYRKGIDLFLGERVRIVAIHGGEAGGPSSGDGVRTTASELGMGVLESSCWEWESLNVKMDVVVLVLRIWERERERKREAFGNRKCTALRFGGVACFLGKLKGNYARERERTREGL